MLQVLSGLSDGQLIALALCAAVVVWGMVLGAGAWLFNGEVF